ncbi:leucine zipper domain-containing protein, partial [Brucella sp. 10RB9210]|uniref:leucine zipper domain-containing protein n=1 Tax=Brucella sp. 10RB9210 TaxID=1844037 RepID=UPI0012AE3FE8
MIEPSLALQAAINGALVVSFQEAVAVLGGRLTKAQAARLYGVSLKIVSRWTERFRISGRAAMTDRSSRPTRSPRQMGQDIVERILYLRRQRLTG